MPLVFKETLPAEGEASSLGMGGCYRVGEQHMMLELLSGTSGSAPLMHRQLASHTKCFKAYFRRHIVPETCCVRIGLPSISRLKNGSHQPRLFR